MFLGWESNTSVWQKSTKLEGGNLSIGGGKSQVPHPLYETLHCVMMDCALYSDNATLGYSFNGSDREDIEA